MSLNSIIFCVLITLCFHAAASEARAQPAFAKGFTRIVTDTATFSLRVELASTQAQRQFGLMNRPRLPPNAGMLFLYSAPEPPTGSFWMFHTRIALDIAFLGADGRILAIQTMTPCESRTAWRCPTYPAGVTYKAALEVNKDYFARHAISVGDRVRLPAEE